MIVYKEHEKRMIDACTHEYEKLGVRIACLEKHGLDSWLQKNHNLRVKSLLGVGIGDEKTKALIDEYERVGNDA